MVAIRNAIYKGVNDREGLYDLKFSEEGAGKPTIVFIHGYMGYKDWGAWQLMTDFWVEKGFNTALFNFTHNGTTTSNPSTFADMDAFGNGGYYKELFDIQLFLKHIEEKEAIREFILVGHSRGGGMAVLAGGNEKVKQIHSLAPISDIATRLPQGTAFENWKKEGVFYRLNTRTQQQMPHYFIQFEEFEQHRDILDIEIAAKQLNKPVFVYHGTNDESVNISDGKQLAVWAKGTFYEIKSADHTFGTREPWEHSTLSEYLQEVAELVLAGCLN